MLDCRRKFFPPSEQVGMIKVTFSIGGVVLETECSQTDTLREQMEFVLDELSDEGVDVDAKVETYVKETIRGAIRMKHNKINNVVNDIHTRHDMEKVDKIVAAKIYPDNMQDAIPKATRIEKRMYFERCVAKDNAGIAYQKQQKLDMEKALKVYTFQASMQVGAYGPVEQVFAGADYVHQETTATNPFAAWNNTGHAPKE